ncbi:MAG: type I pullulanase [Saprospiraceae bacterium]|nr:type I pullulanase [Saprospiraceae bacterium]
MKTFLSPFTMLFVVILMLSSCRPESPGFSHFEEYPYYSDEDLGLRYTPSKSVFKLWAPTANAARLQFYDHPTTGEPVQTKDLKKRLKGVWEATVKKDLAGLYYTFQVRIGDVWLSETPDPYAKAVGTNGLRAQVVNMAATNPPGWENDRRPELKQYTDIILYELHVRDLSIHPNSGIANKGKYLGLTETGTRSPEGLATGLDHLKELGVTHVHLLPVYDFMSIDEEKLEENKFNWGYDPQHYNVPEGSYSTDPADGAVRIREFKQMVKALHDAGIRVVMDVVYNHTGATELSVFNQLVPGYYYRQNAEGGFSNASACGNETASERLMMRKLIVESVKYWASEYHIDGFRFDLMGIHDIETMNLVSAELRKLHPSIYIYGEGWTGGDSPLPAEQRALKHNVLQLDHVAAFSDDVRDAIKGHVFHPERKGFVSGLEGLEESLKFGIVASTRHPQVDYSKINYSEAPWAKNPAQAIAYASCHDNHTLWDRFLESCPEASEAERIQMNKLAAAIVLTCQGVPFVHAGEEMLRTKFGAENSYNLPDSINRLDWSRKARYTDVFEYYKGLIALRKSRPAFRLTSEELIQKHLRFLDTDEPNLVGYLLSDHAGGDEWKEILVVFNGNATAKTIAVPDRDWLMVADAHTVNPEGLGVIKTATLQVPGRSAMILKSI